MININLSQEQEKFLKEFAAQGNNNPLFKNPIHLVQTRKEIIVDEEYGEYDTKHYVPDWNEAFESVQELVETYYEDEECPIPIVPFKTAFDADGFIDIEGEEQIIADEKDYLQAYGINEDFYDRLAIDYKYETVAVFFILNEAKKYIEQQKNQSDYRIYTTDGGEENQGEYNHFWKLLFDIGSQINEKED